MAALLCAVVMTSTVLLPPVVDSLETSTAAYADGTFHYWFPRGSSAWSTTLFLGGLAGWFSGMLAGLAAWLVVVLPWVAVVRPGQLASENAWEVATDPDALRAQRLIGIAFAGVINLVFLVPPLIVVGSDQARADSMGGAFANLGAFLGEPGAYLGDAAWVLGVLLAPLFLALVVLVRLFQVKRAPAAP